MDIKERLERIKAQNLAQKAAKNATVELPSLGSVYESLGVAPVNEAFITNLNYRIEEDSRISKTASDLDLPEGAAKWFEDGEKISRRNTTNQIRTYQVGFIKR